MISPEDDRYLEWCRKEMRQIEREKHQAVVALVFGAIGIAFIAWSLFK